MGERWQRFAAEVGRFLAVGLLATIVALILFNLLVHGFNKGGFAPLNDQPELAYVIANAVGHDDQLPRHEDLGVQAPGVTARRRRRSRRSSASTC